jgi:hypothetical protein
MEKWRIILVCSELRGSMHRCGIMMQAVRSLRLNTDIRIIQADKGNCTVVLDESKYKDKLKTLLEFGVYEPLLKARTAKVERKVRKLLSKHKTALPTDPREFDSIPQQTSTSIRSSKDSQT